MRDELKCAYDWLAAGRHIVVAVVAKTWGSAPRPKGSFMVIHADGHFEGSVSGGCVEGTVIAEAQTLMDRTTSKVLNFTVADSDAWNVGLACGGTIQIQLFPMRPGMEEEFSSALEAFKNRKYGSLRLDKVTSGIKYISSNLSGIKAAQLDETDENLTLAISPQSVLFIVGAVHISQRLAPMAAACDYDVTVIDPRELFVEDRDFPGATIVHEWPDDFFKSHPLDSASALVTLTHDPKIDDAALLCGMRSKAFYIGSLGSKKTHAARVARLEGQGVSTENIKRIFGPVGMRIGAKSPAEIAISIMAELTAIRRDSNAV